MLRKFMEMHCTRAKYCGAFSTTRLTVFASKRLQSPMIVVPVLSSTNHSFIVNSLIIIF